MPASRDYRMYRTGALLGWGAPFDDHVLGFTLEAGGAWFATVAPFTCEQNCVGTAFGAYGQASLYAQWPTRSSLRPFVSPSFGIISISNTIVPNAFAGLDIGLVWDSI
jgi:hypothetical protein